MRRRVAFGLSLASSILLVVLQGPSRAAEPAEEEALREPVLKKLAQLEEQVAALKAIAVNEEDLREIDQILRIARGSVKRGQYSEADVNLGYALPLVEKVQAKVAAHNLERVQDLDNRVRYALEFAREYLAKDPPEEGWAKGKYEEAQKLAEERNALARKTGALPERDFSAAFEPYAKRFASAAPSAGSTPAAATTLQPKGKSEAKYEDLIVRVRGFEPEAFRTAVERHLKGQYAEAKQGYEQVLKDDPDDYRSLFNLGVLEMQLGNPSAAIVPLKKAFDVGLKMDTLDKPKGQATQDAGGISIMSKTARRENRVDVWRGQFLPEAGPLKDACQQTGNVKMAQEVDAALQKRKEELQERARRERAERLPKIETPTPTPTEEPEEKEAVDDSPEGKLKAKLKGQVALARPGATPQEVTDAIGLPTDQRAKGRVTMYYYPTGSVIFVDGKVKEAVQRGVDISEVPESQEPSKTP